MTGLDRLRGYARRMDELHVWPGGAMLREIAGQIEREHDAEVVDSPYDAILPEDREAASWVREHGGLDAVRSEWSSRVPYDKHERMRQRLLGHIAECETALGRRNERIEDLGRRVGDLTRENAELRKRAMPEGMEWPRFEDGARLAFEDELPDFARTIYKTVKTVKFQADGTTVLTNGGGSANIAVIVRPGERVKRPVPKVLDADGVEIREKRDVWWICEGDERGVHAERLHVESVGSDGLVECSPYNGGTWVYLEPSDLYVNEPVIAADGKPLRKEERVYHVETGTELVVKELPKPGEYQAVVVLYLPAGHLMSFDPNLLTHERHESWEQLEKDSKENPFDYCKKVGHRLFTFDNAEEFKSADLVRRAKALAERGEAE